MSIYQRLRIATLAKVREQEIGLLKDPYYAVDHDAIREGLQHLDAEILSRMSNAAQQDEAMCPRCEGSVTLDHRVCVLLYGKAVSNG